MGPACATTALLGIAVLLRFWPSEDLPALDIGKDLPVRSASNDESGLCPWRQPGEDRLRFFPGATGTREETLVLSRLRPRIAQMLGRQPTGQENALQIHRILQTGHPTAASGEQTVGTIITRCVAGEAGLIELVLAVDLRGRVRGARLQRLREPETTARELQSERFLGGFAGRTWASHWKLDAGFPQVSPASRASAQALLDGARTALILLRVGEQTLSK